MKEKKIFETPSEAITGLRHRGHGHDFNLHSEWIDCHSLNLKLKPAGLHVDEGHRFEDMNNPDGAILFAIQSTVGVKGILVDAYGAYACALSSEMIKQLAIDASAAH